MSTDGSVSQWVTLLRDGDHEAAQKLWERYFLRLVALARSRLGDAPRRVADEEDVALSAFDSFCRGAQGGHFPQLLDREDLWRLLVIITGRKSSHLKRDESRKKRGGGANATLLNSASVQNEQPELEDLVDPEPTPAFAAEVAEECRRLLGALGNPELKSVALWKMEGFTNQEVAGKLGCVVRSVERKLRLIRKIWSKELPP